ncbi:imidazolonepropionase-like domain-containing protein [Streptomyces sp. NPDC050145]|uniref:imidazolonepropionase-like domain-containing protein n=1 Tax=Streptomyces sp. NPDC050145 TaxID=3365602 RepID=UPI00379E05E2
MRTLHACAADGSAVLVDGERIAALGSADELVAAHPGVRVREWPGILTPGLLNPYGPEILEGTYHPDPREADTYGTTPIGGERARAIFRADPSRVGASARRGVQRLFAHGTVAIAGELRSRPVLEVAQRSGLAFAARPDRLPGPVSLSPRPMVLLPALTVGGPARFAIFDVPSREELVAQGASTCVATVVGGRLVYRGR